ncbi:unnamed protein product [Thelazia callipaeda]|uniref:Secreted protein n=1 Tax=Thelazia callipaeda TaxID=103827 RepID=A0A0N5CRL4_THECL|nr:unnamed protein product [Thelazia callipaeda]
MQAACTVEEEMATPCRCCKISCWYNTANAATNKLGHVPGQASQHEALATLRLIRLCILVECEEICPTLQRGLFKPV